MNALQQARQPLGHPETSTTMLPQHTVRGWRVLVTGGSGFVGSRVVAALVASGADVISVDLQLPSWCLPQVRVEPCDVRAARFAELVAEVGPHVIVHLAAQVGVPMAERAPAFDADVNVCGTIRVAEAAAAASTRLVVFASSCAVYGSVPGEALPVREDRPVTPVSPYGLSKAAAMDYLEWFARQGRCAVTSLILGNIYGPGSRGVIGQFLADAAVGRCSMLEDAGRTTRDFIHVADVADAFVRACTTAPAGRIHIGSGTETSVAQLWHHIAAFAGHRHRPRHGPARSGDVARMVLSIERAADRLGWAPQIGLREGLATLTPSAWEVSA